MNACVGETVGILANTRQLVCSTAVPQTKLTFITDAALARPPRVYKQLFRLKQCPVMAAQGGLFSGEPQTWVSLYKRLLYLRPLRGFAGLVQGNSYHSV